MFACKERHTSNLVRAEFVGKRLGGGVEGWQVGGCIKELMSIRAHKKI